MTARLPERALVESQVERLCEHRLFRGSERLRRFLGYTVEQCFSGRDDRIKEYVLGVEVFDRGVDFDPRVDPIVRVEAGRLRAKLDEYYSGDGSADSVRIRYPKGTYVPVFETDTGPTAPSTDVSGRRASARPLAVAVLALLATMAIAAAVRWWPEAATAPKEERSEETSASGSESTSASLAVLPLESYDAELQTIADTATEALITELAKLGPLEVRSRTTVMQYRDARRPIGQIAEELGVCCVVEGGVVGSATDLHLKIRLVDAARDRKIWAGSFPATGNDIVHLQTQVAREIAAALQQHGGSR